MLTNDDTTTTTVKPFMFLERNSDAASIPFDIHIGFYKDVSKSDVINLVKGYAEKNFNTKGNIFYQIKKHSDGYLFEIHQGGSGRGYLSDLLDKFDKDNLIIVTSEYVYKVYQSHQSGTKLLKITNNQLDDLKNNLSEYTLLKSAEKINKVAGLERYLLFFSFIICVLGLISASLVSGIYVYSVYFKGVPNQLEFRSESQTDLLGGIEEVKSQAKRLGQRGYIKRIEYMKGDKKWLVTKGYVSSLNTPSPSDSKLPEGETASEAHEIINNIVDKVKKGQQ